MHIQVLNAGGILDHALWLIKDRWTFFVAVICLFLIPIDIAAHVLIELAFPYLPDNPDFAVGKDFYLFIPDRQLIDGVYFVFWVFLVWPVIDGTLAYGYAMVYLERPVTLSSACRYVIPRLPRLLTVNLVFGIGLLLGLVCTLGVGTIWLIVIWGLTMPIVVLENTPLSQAFARSYRLMRGHKWRVLLLVIITFLISFWVQTFVDLIPLDLLGIALSQTVEGITGGILTVIFVVTYFSARCKVENLDLDLLVEAVDPPQVPSALL